MWLVAHVVLLVIALLTITLGATWPFAIAIAVIGVSVGAWAVQKMRDERSAHEAASAQWAASQAVLTERMAIARDLHDLVSHGLGLITVRAAAAKHVNATEPDPNDLLEALDDVETISRQATGELRYMLRTLRESADPAPLRPADTLATMPEIVEAARRAGLSVEVSSTPLPPVSAGVQVAICAVVREGLTNTARHAGATDVQVSLSRQRGGVSVAVVDAGPTRPWQMAPGAGHGLVGLRERVTSLGGTLDAGPHGSGYRLAASLPDGLA